MATNKDFTIYKGKTFTQVVRWESAPFIYKPITAITQGAPVRITATTHGIPDGWEVVVESVKGMTAINGTERHKATLIDPNTIELNEINSLDFKAYSSGGVLKYYTPTNLTGYTARMTIRDKIGGAAISTLVSPTDIVIDNTAKTIVLSISATASALITAKKGVYDLELVSSGGVVTGLLSGSVTFVAEVTT